MANIDQVYGGGLLKAEDILGRTITVTIETVSIQDFDDGKKLKLTFVGKDKALICNVTNSNIIAENTGSKETNDWIGRKITLKTEKVPYGGKIVNGIRVVLEQDAPPMKKSASSNDGPPLSDDDAPAEDDINF